jgi:hypothetical protein
VDLVDLTINNMGWELYFVVDLVDLTINNMANLWKDSEI